MLITAFTFSCKKDKAVEVVKQQKTKVIEPKEPLSSLPSVNLYDYAGDLQVLINLTSCQSGVLNFNSNVDVTYVIDELERIQEDWNNSFEANFDSSISADELEDMDEKYGFDEEQPLKDFENAFPCYQSLRKQIEDEEEIWLANSGNNLDINSDPTDNYVTTDEILQTLLNSNSEIKIDYQLNDLTGLYDVNQDLEITRDATDCKSYKRKVKWFTPPGTSNTKIKAISSLEGNTPWGGAVDAKTKSYKKRNNRYYKSRAQIFVKLDGNSKVRNNDCTVYQTLTLREKDKKRKKVKVKERSWGKFIDIKKISTETVFDIVSFHGLNGIYWNVKM